MLKTFLRVLLVLVVSCGITSRATAQKDQILLNVSYDPTRELYEVLLAINELGEDRFEVVRPSVRVVADPRDGDRQSGRETGHPCPGAGLPGLPVQRGRTDNRRETLLPSAFASGSCIVCHVLSQAHLMHHRCYVWRVAERPTDALQRWWHLRANS